MALQIARPNQHRILNINLLTPNDPYRGRTAALTSKVTFYILIQTNVGTECFKYGI